MRAPHRRRRKFLTVNKCEGEVRVPETLSSVGTRSLRLRTPSDSRSINQFPTTPNPAQALQLRLSLVTTSTYLIAISLKLW
ncbi:hypothetical protein K432DRAFT_386793 [Lepidopterella palustris CBS 459.81]|uniref:Uncharacterized protein n=1 Tax=Lepidopterella palustris CBS 459.81 TaxID=1314670 RepID=A0A8E2DZI6_9PEZI|nr:hypothetical protein K432DRAFT_386793 [Lepidopterella palustris CBS 459.81]